MALSSQARKESLISQLTEEDNAWGVVNEAHDLDDEALGNGGAEDFLEKARNKRAATANAVALETTTERLLVALKLNQKFKTDLSAHQALLFDTNFKLARANEIIESLQEKLSIADEKEVNLICEKNSLATDLAIVKSSVPENAIEIKDLKLALKRVKKLIYSTNLKFEISDTNNKKLQHELDLANECILHLRQQALDLQQLVDVNQRVKQLKLHNEKLASSLRSAKECIVVLEAELGGKQAATSHSSDALQRGAAFFANICRTTNQSASSAADSTVTRRAKKA